jgi:hypothetical protein
MTDMSIIHYRHFEPERVQITIYFNGPDHCSHPPQGYQTLSKDDTAALVSSFPI